MKLGIYVLFITTTTIVFGKNDFLKLPTDIFSVMLGFLDQTGKNRISETSHQNYHHLQQFDFNTNLGADSNVINFCHKNMFDELDTVKQFELIARIKDMIHPKQSLQCVYRAIITQNEKLLQMLGSIINQTWLKHSLKHKHKQLIEYFIKNGVKINSIMFFEHRNILKPYMEQIQYETIFDIQKSFRIALFNRSDINGIMTIYKKLGDISDYEFITHLNKMDELHALLLRKEFKLYAAIEIMICLLRKENEIHGILPVAMSLVFNELQKFNLKKMKIPYENENEYNNRKQLKLFACIYDELIDILQKESKNYTFYHPFINPLLSYKDRVSPRYLGLLHTPNFESSHIDIQNLFTKLQNYAIKPKSNSCNIC